MKNEWKLMMMPSYYTDWTPIYVHNDSPKMMTYRALTGRCGQTKETYIDYPRLGKVYRSRISTWKTRELSNEELTKYEPLLEEALSHDLPKYAEGY